MMSPHPDARRRNGLSAMIPVSMITAIGVCAPNVCFCPSFSMDAWLDTTPSWLAAVGTLTNGRPAWNAESLATSIERPPPTPRAKSRSFDVRISLAVITACQFASGIRYSSVLIFRSWRERTAASPAIFIVVGSATRRARRPIFRFAHTSPTCLIASWPMTTDRGSSIDFDFEKPSRSPALRPSPLRTGRTSPRYLKMFPCQRWAARGSDVSAHGPGRCPCSMPTRSISEGPPTTHFLPRQRLSNRRRVTTQQRLYRVPRMQTFRDQRPLSHPPLGNGHGGSIRIPRPGGGGVPQGERAVRREALLGRTRPLRPGDRARPPGPRRLEQQGRRPRLHRSPRGRPRLLRQVPRREPVLRDCLVQSGERILVPGSARAGRGVLRPRPRAEAGLPRRPV